MCRKIGTEVGDLEPIINDTLDLVQAFEEGHNEGEKGKQEDTAEHFGPRRDKQVVSLVEKTSSQRYQTKSARSALARF